MSTIFAMALDSRIGSIDVDMKNFCYAKPVIEGKTWTSHESIVPFILKHGDILQWMALDADRLVTVRNIPSEAGNPESLQAIFTVLGNSSGLKIIDSKVLVKRF